MDQWAALVRKQLWVVLKQFGQWISLFLEVRVPSKKEGCFVAAICVCWSFRSRMETTWQSYCFFRPTKCYKCYDFRIHRSKAHFGIPAWCLRGSPLIPVWTEELKWLHWKLRTGNGDGLISHRDRGWADWRGSKEIVRTTMGVIFSGSCMFLLL